MTQWLFSSEKISSDKELRPSDKGKILSDKRSSYKGKISDKN